MDHILGKDIGLVKSKYDFLQGKIQIGIVYIDYLANHELISNQIIRPLLQASTDILKSAGDLSSIISKIIYSPDKRQYANMEQVIDNLLTGNTVLFIQDSANALTIQSRKVEKRSVEKPNNEVTALASNDAFIEDIDVNCSLIINRLPTPDLRFEEFTVGSLSHTKVKLIWIEGVANQGAVDEARRRIQKIDAENVDGIGQLSELIEDNRISVFPKYKQSQRPDAIAKFLSEGRFALLCSNSPFGLAAPFTFWDNFKTMDDYAERPLVSSFLRCIRILSFILASTVSPLYLCFVTYNHNIIPTALAMNIQLGRVSVPFPSVVELLLMSLSITIIREAAMRIPGTVGYFIGTLAAVILGQAAVSAGYVSASVIIVVAITAISAYAISTSLMVYPSRLVNYFLIFWSAFMGMYGFTCGLIIVICHIASLQSFGTPYLYPLTPFGKQDVKNTIIRSPFRAAGTASKGK